MFCDVFAGFASTLEIISIIREDKKDKRIKLALKTIACSFKEKDNV
jgi:hypothetical protein